MSGYDETNPEAYRPAEPGQAAEGSHTGVGSPSALSQGGSAAAASGSEPPIVPPHQAGYEDLSQAYGAGASQDAPALPGVAPAVAGGRTEYTQQLPAGQATSQMPADQPTSVYAASQQQGQYPAYSQGQQAPYNQSASQQSHPGQQAHLGSPYTSVPTTPGGYASAGAGESFYATSNVTGSENGSKRRRGPGWFALVASVVVASLLGAGGAVGAIKALDARDGGASQRSSAAPTAIATGDTS